MILAWASPFNRMTQSVWQAVLDINPTFYAHPSLQLRIPEHRLRVPERRLRVYFGYT